MSLQGSDQVTLVLNEKLLQLIMFYIAPMDQISLTFLMVLILIFYFVHPARNDIELKNQNVYFLFFGLHICSNFKDFSSAFK